MNKKSLFLMVLFLLIFTSVSYADVCEVARTKDVLRNNLYLYLINPSSSTLTLNEIMDLLVFYLGIVQDLITVDCSETGSSSSQTISTIIESGSSAPDLIPTCSDGTKNGECSNTKPKFCYGGSIIHKCKTCGCPSGNSCNSVSNNCDSAGNITCFNNLDCGTSQFIGDYYCSSDFVTKNYLNYTCINPGTSSSSCVSSTSPVTLSYCDPFLNQTCVAGNANCQINATSSDNILPTVSITNPISGAIVNGSITISANASDNVGVIGVQFLLDGNNLGVEDSISPYSMSWDTSTVGNGIHLISARARDAAGNTRNAINIIVNVSNSLIDTTPPSVSITSPISGSNVSGSSVTVSANVFDNIGVVGVQFKLNGGNLGAEDTFAPYSMSWNTTTTTNGAHTLTAVARDAAGNINTSLSVFVTVSNPINQNPIAIINYSLGINLSVRFNGSLSYDLDGFITLYNWTFGDAAQSSLSVVTHNYLNPGLYNATLKVKDNNGAFGSTSRIINVT